MADERGIPNEEGRTLGSWICIRAQMYSPHSPLSRPSSFRRKSSYSEQAKLRSILLDVRSTLEAAEHMIERPEYAYGWREVLCPQCESMGEMRRHNLHTNTLFCLGMQDTAAFTYADTTRLSKGARASAIAEFRTMGSYPLTSQGELPSRPRINKFVMKFTLMLTFGLFIVGGVLLHLFRLFGGEGSDSYLEVAGLTLGSLITATVTVLVVEKKLDVRSRSNIEKVRLVQVKSEEHNHILHAAMAVASAWEGEEAFEAPLSDLLDAIVSDERGDSSSVEEAYRTAIQRICAASGVGSRALHEQT